MNNSYLKYYRDKIRRKGSSSYERNYKLKEREFDDYFRNALTKEQCLVDGVSEYMIFQDHSQSNNKDLSDDKYIVCPNSVKVSIGSYISWRDSIWMVFTEEFKTIPTHQQLKIKHANEEIKWLKEGKIVSYNAYVQSQTLYTLGVKVDTHLASVDSKMMMYMQNNDNTSSLKISDRIFVGKKVYKVTFMDAVSRQGLINYLLDEDTIGEYDNVELGVADYYKSYKPDEEVEEPITTEIEGVKTPKIGSTHEYTLNEKDVNVSVWNVESAEVENPFMVISKDEKSITLQFKNDYRYVGSIVNLIAELDNGKIISLTIRTIKKY